MRSGKFIILICTFMTLSSGIFAQTPLGFNYQGVARSADGSPLINQFIGLRVSITSGPSGSTDYVEDHHPETNEFGLFSIVVGQGQSSGNIADVDWGAGNKWLQIEIDPQDNANYILVGSQQMMSVPYSLYSAKSGEALNPGIGIDISNGQINNVLPDQTVSLIGNGAATVTGTYPNFEVDVTNIDDADADPANEIQTLSKTGNTVSLSNSGGSFTDEVIDADADPANEIQTLSEVLAVKSDAGAAVITNLADPIDAQDAATKSYVDALDGLNLDKDATNEIQNLTSVLTEDASAGNLAITDLANPINIQDAATKNYVDAQDALDLDQDVTNEIQNLSDVLNEDPSAGNLAITNLANPTNAQDAATKNYVDTSDATLSTSISSNTSDISTESTNRSDADASLQGELDDTQTGTGLNADGTYDADPTTVYIDGSSTLKQSDKLLDAQIATNSGAISNNSTAIATESTARTTTDATIQSELNITQTGAGLAGDGTYIQDGTTNYTAGATSLQNADKLIDDQVNLNEIGIASNSSDIVSLNTAVSSAYAFKVPITATTSSDLSFDFSTWTINENITIIGSTISITESGIYSFIIKGSSSLATPSNMYIKVNTTDHLVKIDNFSYYSDTFLFQLVAGNTIELRIVSGGSSEDFNLEFFGYKI